MSERRQYFPLAGGLDLVSPAMSIKSGAAIIGINYECDVNGGYRRVTGYERFDGQPAPSEAKFYGVKFRATADHGDDYPWAAGQTITGQTSGATGVLFSVQLDRLSIGGYGVGGYGEDGYGGGSYPAEYLGVFVFLEVSGSFVKDETLVGSIGENAIATTNMRENLAGNDDAYAEALIAAQELRRQRILPPPGVGPVRGVWRHRSRVYCVRDFNGNEARLYRSTNSGWARVPLGYTIQFERGDYEIALGDTIQDGNGGSAEVLAIVKTAGSWRADPTESIPNPPAPAVPAVGYIVVSGGVSFVDSQPIRVDGNIHAYSDGAMAGNTIKPGGRYETVEHNFFGAPNRERIYGVDGVNRAFEFGGPDEVFSYIRTGLSSALDRPQHIAAHRGRIYLSLRGGSVLGSATGEPSVFDAVIFDAVEFRVGQPVTGLVTQPEVLCIFCADSTQLLYSTDAETFDLRPGMPDVGAAPFSIALLGLPYFLDGRGVRGLAPVQTFGNFDAGLLSDNILPLLNSLKGKERCASVVRQRGIYRLFFEDGTAISMTLSGLEPIGFMTQAYKMTAFCSHTSEDAQSRELVYVGADDGFVYQMERGISFDGKDIQSYVRLAFNHFKRPRHRKRFRRAVFELSAPINCELRVVADYSYATQDMPAPENYEVLLQGGGAFWNGGIWDEFAWNSKVVNEARIRMDGFGTNISLLVYSRQIAAPHVLQGVIVDYTDRRPER